MGGVIGDVMGDVMGDVIRVGTGDMNGGVISRHRGPYHGPVKGDVIGVKAGDVTMVTAGDVIRVTAAVRCRAPTTALGSARWPAIAHENVEYKNVGYVFE